MAKKATKPISPQEMGLRRWCVEMAERWPIHLGDQMPDFYADEDVIGRAQKIYDWVTK